jgi:exosortase A
VKPAPMRLTELGGAPDSAATRSGIVSGPWIALVVALLAVALLHADSLGELVQVWYRSVSYNHCFLVLPVAAWLIWRDRTRLDGVLLKPWMPGLLILAALGALWLIGRAAAVNSLRDFAVVATLPVIAVTLLGRAFSRAMIFPLSFVLFAWPFGEMLIPTFIDRTADFTVWALRLTGVPVFREGNSFVIPSGHWSVVEECSGIRYLMASASAGSVFGHLYMRSLRRRWAFFGIAVLVPIVANWLRAYLIVLLGHLSDNRLAAGVDHVIYGWVFFGAVMLGVFLLGARWADRDAAGTPMQASPRTAAPSRIWAAAVVAVLVAGAAPLWMRVLDARDADTAAPPIPVVLPSPRGDWQVSERQSGGWVPRRPAASAFSAADYTADGRRVTVSVALSRETGDGEKLLTFASTALAEYDIAQAQTLARAAIPVPALGAGARVIERRMRFGGQEMLVWEWYRVDGLRTDSVARAKVEQALRRIGGHRPLVGRWTVHVRHDSDVAAARETLVRFVDAHRADLDLPASASSSPQ